MYRITKTFYGYGRTEERGFGYYELAQVIYSLSTTKGLKLMDTFCNENPEYNEKGETTFSVYPDDSDFEEGYQLAKEKGFTLVGIKSLTYKFTYFDEDIAEDYDI